MTTIKEIFKFLPERSFKASEEASLQKKANQVKILVAVYRKEVHKKVNHQAHPLSIMLVIEERKLIHLILQTHLIITGTMMTLQSMVVEESLKLDQIQAKILHLKKKKEPVQEAQTHQKVVQAHRKKKIL